LKEVKYTISAVSYLNTKPFLHGLEQSQIYSNIILKEHHPAQCAIDLLDDRIDIGLVPVAIIPLLSNPHIVSPYCIGANGNVRTVSLFSRVPIEEINTVYLDEQSRTSVLLVQILFKEYWKKEVQFLPAYQNYENNIKENEAAVVIGDRCINILDKYKYNYDLAAIWKQHTQLPFVFATWVSNKNIDSDFLIEFNAALKVGLNQRAVLAEKYTAYNTQNFNVKSYWEENIQYVLNENMQQALALFLQKINPNQQIMYCY
jgi:chorismate dehydratase